MRIVALSSGNGWHVEDLRRAAALRGIELAACSWKQVSATVGDASAAITCGPVSLHDADAVLLRTMPAGSLEQIVFRMDAMHRLMAAGVPVINPPRAIETAVDKYLAIARMREAGLPVPATAACQRLDDAMTAFDRLGGDVVVKPLFGSEGFGITRLDDRDLAARVLATLERLGAVLYLQRFIPHDGSDLRLLVVGDRVLTAMRRRSTDWRTNIARGGVGEPFEPDDHLRDLALRAARACEALIAGVDIVIDPREGQPYLLEVNAVPGWRELQRVTGVDIATAVLAYMQTVVASSAPLSPGERAGVRGSTDDHRADISNASIG
ncbi:MAG: RimK family alpha-L-glutamate ligase [Phycisphaeraceae bacterium]